MIALLLGTLGFLLALPTDWLCLRGWTRARSALMLAGAATQTVGLVLAVLGAEKLVLAPPLVWAGWGLLPIALGLFVYSLFLEIPFANSYLRSASQLPAEAGLVTTGTYALTRHPGVLWYTLLLLSLVLISQSRDLLVAAPVWVMMDTIWVVLQDRWFFPEMFRGYPEYTRKTPMLWPTRNSIAACWTTLGRRHRRSRAIDRNEPEHTTGGDEQHRGS